MKRNGTFDISEEQRGDAELTNADDQGGGILKIDDIRMKRRASSDREIFRCEKLSPKWDYNQGE